MNRLTVSVLFVVSMALLIGCSAGDTPEESAWTAYGGEITLDETLPLAEAVENLDAYAETPVLVSGEIADVCNSKGCWMVVKDGDAEVRVRFVDYSFFVPWESTGKAVRVEGTLRKQTVSEEVARHWAEEAKEPRVKPEDIHGEQEIIMMMASAVLIEGGTELSEAQLDVIEGRVEGEQEH
jgi:hypothetical protein